MKRIAFIARMVTGLSLLSIAYVASAQTPQASPMSQGDAKVGAQKVQMCQGCHGIPGWRSAYPEVFHVPKIAGQHSTYFVSALKAYKSGERKHAGMRSIVASLSEKDMADLAAYYTEAK